MNPLIKSQHEKKPFVYWHLHVVNHADLDAAREEGKMAELDMSFSDKSQQPFIGHPENFYTEVKKIPKPENISIAELEEYLQRNPNIYLMLDCKDTRAFPQMERIINQLEADRIVCFAFIKDWSFPYPQDAEIEAHWQYEDIPLADIREFQRETNTVWIGAIRGFSEDWLTQNNLVDKALKSAEKTFASIGVYLPGTVVPSLPVLQKIYVAGYLPWFNADKLEITLPFPYVAMSDELESATSLR